MADFDLDLGDDLLSITDEDGNEFELEVLDETEYKGLRYLIAVETGPDDTSEQEAVILKYVTDEETGEELLSTPDTEEEYDEVYNLFMAQMFNDEIEE